MGATVYDVLMGEKIMMQQQPRLLDQLRYMLRLKHRRLSTERSYVNWVKRFILYHDKTHPREMGAKEVQAFLTHLAVDRKVASSTQNQARYHARLSPFICHSFAGARH